MPPTPAEEKGKNLLYFLSPAIAALVFFLYALRPGYIFFWYDTSLIHLPLKQFFHNSIASGDFPTWARHFLFGFPILGHGDAAYLYPLSAVLFSLFEPTRIYNVFIVSHYLLAGLFCYCFLRALAVRRESAAFGAIIYALNGFSLGHLHHATILCGYAYLPLLLWAVEIAARGNPFRGALIWALGLWLVTTASQPQMLLYCVCLSAAFWLWRALSQEKSNRLLPTRILAMLVGTAAGAMLAALHIIPFLDVLSATERVGRLPYLFLTSGSLQWRQLVTFLLPNRFGTIIDGTWSLSPDPAAYMESCGYCGLLPLVLLPGLIRRRTDSQVVFFACLGLVGLVLSLGSSTPLYRVVAAVPLLNQARIPARWLSLVMLSVAVLGALGMQSLLSQTHDRPVRRHFLSLVFVATLLLLLGAPLVTDKGLLMANIHAPIALLLTASAVVVCSCNNRLPVVWKSVVLFAVLLLDISVWGGRLNPVVPSAIVFDPPPLSKQITSPDFSRTAHLPPSQPPADSPLPIETGWKDGLDKYRNTMASLPGNSSLLYDVAVVGALSGTQLRDTKAILGMPAVSGGSLFFNRDASSPLLELAGVNYYINNSPVAEKHWKRLTDHYPYLFARSHAESKAFLVHDSECIPDEVVQTAYLSSGKRDFRQTALLFEESPLVSSGVTPSASEQVTIAEYSDKRVVVNVTTQWQSMLVLSDQYFPGWRAYVNGVETRIFKADGAFRSVMVEPGSHRVEFVFDPSWFRSASLLTLVGIALCVILLILSQKAKFFAAFTPQITKKHLIWFGLLFLVLLYAVREPSDSDLWWHMASGRYIVNEGRVPQNDVLSFSTDSAPWIYYSWLFGVLAYAVTLLSAGHSLGSDLLVLQAAQIILCLAIFLSILLFHRKEHFWSASALLALAIVASSVRWILRPHLFGQLYLVLFYVVCDSYHRHGKKALFALPLVMILWVNMHGTYVLAPCVVGAFLVATLLGRDGSSSVRKAFVFGCLLVAVCLLVGLNPYGFSVLRVPLELASSAELRDKIGEWGPPLRFDVMGPQGVLYLIAIGAFIHNLVQKRFASAFVLLAPLALYPVARRHVDVLAVLVPLCAAEPFGIWCRFLFARAPKWGFVLAAALMLLTVSRGIFLLREIYGRPSIQVRYPFAALDFAVRNGLHLKYFSKYEWAGQISWLDHPRSKHFVDARFRVFNQTLRGDYEEIIHATPDAMRLLDQYGCEAVLLPYRPGGLVDPLPSLLFDSSEWCLVYWDDLAVLFVRKGLLERERKTDIQISHANPVWLQIPSGLSDEERYLVEKDLLCVIERLPSCQHARLLLADCFRTQGHASDGIQILQSLCSEPGVSFTCFAQLGAALLSEGRTTEAVIFFTEATHRFPREPAAFLNLAQLLMASGDLSGARRAAQNSLNLAPDDQSALQVLASIEERLGNVAESMRIRQRLD